MGYAKTPLFSLKDGNEVFLLVDCYQEDAWGSSGTLESSDRLACSEGQGVVSRQLVIRPTNWNLFDEITSKLEKDDSPYYASDARRLPENLEFPYGGGEAVAFQRPASGLHGTTAEFVGYVVGLGLVWVDSQSQLDASSGRSYKYEVIKAHSSRYYPFLPRLVLRDGNDVWVFAERGGECPDTVCFPVVETLGLSVADIPESLQRKFMLYHATIGGDSSFERVLPARWNVDARGPRPVPPSASIPFNFDTQRIVPRSNLSAFTPDVNCVSRSRSGEYLGVVFVPIPVPIGTMGNMKNKKIYEHCMIPEVASKSATGRNELVPAPDVVVPASAPPLFPDPIPPVPSSYECWPDAIKGQQQVGSGKNGCYYVLREPKTGAPMPNTPYLVAWQGVTDTAWRGYSGITDNMGRTAFLRPNAPIRVESSQVVRRLVSRKDFSAPGSSLARSATEPMKFGGPVRFLSPVGAKVRYRVTLCSGAVFEGYTDPHGWTVDIEPGLNKECPATIEGIW